MCRGFERCNAINKTNISHENVFIPCGQNGTSILSTFTITLMFPMFEAISRFLVLILCYARKLTHVCASCPPWSFRMGIAKQRKDGSFHEKYAI